MSCSFEIPEISLGTRFLSIRAKPPIQSLSPSSQPPGPAPPRPNFRSEFLIPLPLVVQLPGQYLSFFFFFFLNFFSVIFTCNSRDETRKSLWTPELIRFESNCVIILLQHHFSPLLIRCFNWELFCLLHRFSYFHSIWIPNIYHPSCEDRSPLPIVLRN